MVFVVVIVLISKHSNKGAFIQSNCILIDLRYKHFKMKSKRECGGSN